MTMTREEVAREAKAIADNIYHNLQLHGHHVGDEWRTIMKLAQLIEELASESVTNTYKPILESLERQSQSIERTSQANDQLGAALQKIEARILSSEKVKQSELRDNP